MIVNRKITVVTITRRNKSEDLNEKLQRFGNAIGLFSARDKDKSCFRIFIQLLKAGKRNMGMTSDELAYVLKLTRGTVVHHLNRLMAAGVVITDEGKYFIRVNNLEMLVEEIKKDMTRTLDDLQETAKDIDKELGI